MQTKSAKSMKPLYMLILSIIIIVAFFVISPTVAKAVDPPPEPEPVEEEEEEEEETEPVEDGAAQIGAVEVTDGTIETFDTQPEIQDALGIPADTEIEFENTPELNAVQQAIDAALGYASDQAEITSATVLVDDGTYLNGLTISTSHTVTTTDETTGEVTTTEETYNLAEDFILNIIASDAQDEDDGSMTNSAGGANVDGEITIDGINVLIAGLYFVTGSVVKVKSAEVEIYGTTADDTIDTDLTSGAVVAIDGGQGNDDISVGGTLGTSLTTDDVTIEIDGGGGDDTITVDTSTTLNTYGGTEVVVEGGDGGDRLHLTGKLDSGGAHTGTRSGANDEDADVTLFTSAMGGALVQQLDISATGVEAYTDELSGKDSVDLSGSSAYHITDIAGFTDYNILGYTGGGLVVTIPEGIAPFLAGLILDGGEFTAGTIYAPAFNITISGRCITIDGTITGRNININASDSDVQIGFSTDFDSALIPDFEFEFSLFDFVSKACIKINESGVLNASETITLSVTSTQTQSLLPDASQLSQAIENLTAKAQDPNNPNQAEDEEQLNALEELAVNPNFINIKVGTATITILGTLSAVQSIRATADAQTVMEVTNEDLAKWCIPLGVSVAVVKAKVSVGGSAAIICTQGGVALGASTNVTVKTKAVSGTIPIALALSVVDVKAIVSVAGNAAISALNGSVVVSASGNLTVETIATVPATSQEGATSGGTSKSGGFFAVGVVIQTVTASITGNATLAAGDILLGANAKEKVLTQSSTNNSSVNDKEGDEDGSFSLTDILNLVTSLLGKLSGSGGETPLAPEGATDSLNTAGEQVKPPADPPEDPPPPTDPPAEDDDEDMGLSSLFGDEDEEEPEPVGVTDAFDEGTGGAADTTQVSGSSSSTQLVGALAVTYASNKNTAAIKTTGSILSGGALSADATASVDVRTLADGSPIVIETKPDGTPVEEPISITGGVITTADGDTPPDPPTVAYKAAAAPTITGGTLGTDGTVTPTGAEVTLDGITITVTGGKTIITGATGITQGAASITVPPDPCVIAGGTTTVTGANLVITGITGATTITVVDGVVAIANATVAMNGGTTTNTGGTFDIPSSDIALTGVTIDNMESFGLEIPDGVAPSQLPTWDNTEAPELLDDGGDPVILPNIDAASLEGGSAEITDGTAAFSGAAIGLTVIGGNRNADGSIITMADVEITGATLTVSEAYLSVTDGTITGCVVTNFDNTTSPASITGGVIKYSKGTVTITGAVIKLSLVHVTISGTPGSENVKLSGGTVVTEGGAAVVTTTAEQPPTTAIITDAKLTTEPVTPAPGDSSFSLGVGISVGIVIHRNTAYIEAAVITAQSLSIIATSNGVSSQASASAGVSECDIGIAGAVAVHIVSSKTNARLGSSATIDGGSVAVQASQSGGFTTSADAIGTGTGSKVGIGAGISIGIIGVDVNAIIPDGVEILTPPDVSIDELTVSAEYEGTENLHAKAGIAGGTAVVPVLALGVSGVSTNATLGTGTTAVSVVQDTVISAANDITREMDADAAATGSSVAVGAALSVGICNDNAGANLNRSVTSRNVRVLATSKSSMTSTAKAGANGAAPSGEASTPTTPPEGGEEEEDPDPSGETDELADKNVAAAGLLAGGSGTSNVNPGAVSDLSADRQTSQTSEGNVKVAAGLALNIQKNCATANIGDGVHITAIYDDTQPEEGEEPEESGTVAVTSINQTNAEISANASATQAAIGVGVAVAINIVIYDNTAMVGSSRITAQMLIVSALLPPDEEEEEDEEEDDNSLKGKIITIIKMFVEDVLTEISASVGLDELFDTSDVITAVADLVEELATDFVDIMIEGSGLENLFNGDIDELIGEALASIENLPSDAFDVIKDVVIEELKNKVMELIPSSGGTPAGDTGKSGLSVDFQAIVTDVVTGLTEKFFNFEELLAMLQAPLVEAVKTKLTTFAEGALEDIKNAAIGVLVGWLGTDAVELTGHTISTEAISGAGASDVGVAGAVALAVVVADTNATIAGMDTALPVDMLIAGDTTLFADATHIIKTASSSAVGDDGKADKNKDAEANANADATGGSEPAPTADETTTGPDTGGDPVSPSEDNGAGSGKSVGVGASFSFNYINIDVLAGIGENRTLVSGALVIKATLQNRLETISVSGSDPLANSSGDPAQEAKDISVDASVAVGLIFNTVKAYVSQGTSVTTTSGNTFNINESEDEEYDDLLNLYIYALEQGSTITRASGFTVGASTAVGAAVAVNIASSDVDATFEGTGVIAGVAKILAHTYNEDDAKGIATAVGAETDRYLSKFRDGQNDVETNTNKVLAGDYSGTEETNDNNETAGKINGELDKNSNSEEEGSAPTPTNNNAPLSANALGAFDVGTQSDPDTSEGSGAVEDNVTDLEGNPVSSTTGSDQQESQKVRVAAALGVNITLHNATSSVTGSLEASAISVLAQNNGNFNAMGTGAAVSIDKNANSIGVGVAVSVNMNEAHAQIGGTITATGDAENDPDIIVDANLTQNMDGKYKGLLGAQALAGSVTGNGSKVCISAALAVIVSLSKATATILADAIVEGGGISVSSADKSKLAVRAGAISLSTGASVGAGVSFAIIFAHNEVFASVGTGASITGDSFSLTAQKIKVDFSDYESEFGIDNMLTAEAPPGEEGIVNIRKEEDSEGEDVYETDINFDTDSALGFVNLLNFLSSTNYYAESISGAVNTASDGKLTASGSFAFVLFFNNTAATVGDGVSIGLTGDMDVHATADTTARVIAGAVSVSNSKVGVGATVGVIANNDKITASIGNKGAGTGVDSGGALDILAAADMDMMLITVAVGATASGTAIGGTIDVIVTLNDVKALIADHASVKADGDINIIATNDAFLLFIALSAAGSGGQTAVGGTFAVLVSKNSAQALVGDHVLIDSENGAVRIGADNKEIIISILAALSGSTGGTAVAATLNVMITLSRAKAIVGDHTTIDAGGDIYVDVTINTFMLAIVAALSGSTGGVAVGATLNVCVFDRDAFAHVGSNSTLTSELGDIVIQALAKDFVLILTASIALSGGGAGISGSIPVVVGLSKIEAMVGENSTLDADGSVGVIADLKSNVFVPAVSVALSSGPGIGATISTTVLNNIINAIICGGCTIIANANKQDGLVVPKKDAKRKGVIVSATARENMVVISISGAAGGGVAVAGVLNTLVIVNKVTAQIRSRERNSSGDPVGIATHSITSGDEVLVSADDDSIALNIAGSLAAGGGAAGVGATLVVLVFYKEVTASIEDFGTLSADGAVTVEAGASDVLTLFAITFGAAATVGVSASVNAAVYLNTVKAYLGGEVTKSASVDVVASTEFVFVNFGAGAGAAGTVGVGAVFVITFFYNKTSAYILSGAVIKSDGAVTVRATSKELLVAVAMGVGGAGVVGVSGSLELAVTMVETKAYTQDNVKITSGSLKIEADDRYMFIGVVGAIGGAGAVGVGVSVQLSVAFNTIEASIGTNNTIETTIGDVEVLASSNRDFDAYTVSGGGGGYAGVSVAVAIMVAGAQMTSEAADVLVAERYHIEYDIINGEMVARLDSDGNPIIIVDGSGDPVVFLDGDVGLYTCDRAEPKTQVDYAFSVSNPHARGYENEVALGDKLDSSGTSAEDYNTDAGALGQEDDSKDDNEEEADRVRDNMDTGATGAATSAPAPPEYNLWDTTSAFIGTGSSVKSAGDIIVLATDSLKADLVTGTVSGSVFAAVGVCLAIAVLNSDVLAYVDSGAALQAVGAINIGAYGKHGDSLLFPNDDDEQMFPSGKTEQDRKDDQDAEKDGFLSEVTDLASKVPGLSDYTIRCIVLSAGGALVSVNVVLSAVSVFTQTKAFMAGDVTSASALNVVAKSDYGRVIALTLGIGGGAVSVKVSFSLVVYQSRMEASICSLADIRNVGSIYVRSESDTTANALAACLSGGGISVNAASAIALNLTRVDTFIGQGVSIGGSAGGTSGTIEVSADIDTAAEALILSFSVGGGAFGVTFALAVLNPLVQSYIGVTPKGDIIDHSSVTSGTPSGSIAVSGAITVINDVQGTANAIGISFAASGMQSLNGTVGVAVNSISGYAAINKTNVSGSSITVTALMDGDATVRAYAITISGANAIGIVIAIAIIESDNRALIDTTGSSIIGGAISVLAGGESGGYDSKAYVDVKTATLAASTVALNVGLTINRAGNRAIVQGSSGSMNASGLIITARGISQADTLIQGVNAGLIAIAMSVGIALLNSTQEAILQGGASYTLGALTVRSYQNTDQTDDYDAVANIFAGGGGLLSATAFITVATANATGIASAGAASLTVTGEIIIESYGRSNAGVIIQKANIAGVSVGIMVGIAYAKGTFGAYLGSDSAVINTAGVTIYTEYTGYAKADINPSTGGFNVNLVAISGNVGVAEVNTIAHAGIRGTGSVSSTKKISVRVKGTVSAYAVVHGATISVGALDITVNVATATLAADQSAFIDGASVYTTGAGNDGDVSIKSEYNTPGTYDIHGGPTFPTTFGDGATALVGANGGPSVKLSIASGSVNVATANANSTGSAYITGASTDISGSLLVRSFGVSYANADIESPTVSVSLVNVAISATEANASGIYSAYIDSTGSALGIKAGLISVDTRYNTKAIAKVCPGGGVSAAISLTSLTVNSAKANATTNANAYFEGSGAIESYSTIVVTVDGTGIADAEAKLAEVSVSGVDLAANVTKATFSVDQKAYFNVSGTATAAGNIRIDAHFDADTSGGANASTGSPSGASISLAEGSVNSSTAVAKLKSSAYITGGGTISGADIKAEATSITRADAYASSTLAVTFATLGSLYANAYTRDEVTAYVGDNTTLIATGDIVVNANGDTNTDATCETPGSVTLANVSGARVGSSVGLNTSFRQKVLAYVGDSSTLSADGNVSITAYNEGKSTSKILKGVNVSGLSISTCIVKTNGFYYTMARVGENSQITAGGDITITAEDYPDAYTLVKATNVGILIEAGNMYAQNTLSQRVVVQIKQGAILDAFGGINIAAISGAKMYAKTNVNSGGIISAGKLQAYNTITNRNVDALIGDGVSITSNYGNINISSSAGLNDDIYTSAVGNSAGLVTISTAETHTKITSTCDTTVGVGVTIRNTFMTITIAAYNGEGSIQTIGDFGSGGLSSNPLCRAYINDIVSSAKVTIADTPATGYGQTYIIGKYINIYASIKDMFISAHTNAVTSGFHGTAKAYSIITTDIDNDIVISDAHIASYDNTNIIASANPTSSGDNLKAYAGTKITAFIGKIVSEAKVEGHINASVNVKAAADITGAYVKIDANKFKGTVSLTAYGKRRALASKSTTETDDITRGRTVTVNSGATFHIGDAAAGIVIEIAADTSVRAVGILNEKTIWTLAAGSVTISQTIVNAKAGRLVVGGVTNLGSDIYDQHYIPIITLINKSNLNLIIKGIDSFNESYSRPSVYGPFEYNLMNTSEDTTPIINIVSFGSGDVTIGNLSGVIANERGTTNISWENAIDGINGSLYADKVLVGSDMLPSLWTHILNVTGALNIGVDENQRFSAYMATLNGADATVAMNASGFIFTSLTLAEIDAVSILPTSADTSAINGTLLLGDIIAVGAVDIYLPYAVRLKYLAGTTAVALVMPGTLEFSIDTILTAGDVTIDDLAYYASGFNPADMSLGYILPNEAQVYTDANGKVLRIVSDGEQYNLSNYLYKLNGSGELIVTIVSKGVSVNLTTGVLTVLTPDAEAGFEGFELYLGWDLASISLGDGGWELGEGSISKVTEYEAISGIDENGDPIEFDVKQTLWKTISGISYYLVYDERSEIWNTGTSHVYYVIGLDNSDRVVQVYKAQRTEHETDEQTATRTSSTTISGLVVTTVTTSILTFSNFADSGATAKYRKINTYITTFDSDGKVVSTSSSNSYSYIINLGLSMEWVDSYLRVKDSTSGLSADGLAAHTKLQGVIWKKELTENTSSTLKGKMIYLTIDKTADIPLSTVTETVEEETYSYEAFVLDKSGDERKLIVYDTFIYTVGSTEYEIDLDAFTLEFTTDGYFGFTITGGGRITMHAGDTIQLFKNGDDNFRITKHLYIGDDGTVYFRSGATYNGDTGEFECDELIISNTDDATATGVVVMKAGDIHLELLSADVAVDAQGIYYFYTGSAWEVATKTGGIISYGGVTRLTITTAMVDGQLVTYYTLPDNIVIGSDGSITLPPNIGPTTKLTTITAGTDYLLGYIEGYTVTITMENTQGSILDANDTTNPDVFAVNIFATDLVLFKTSTSGTIGTTANPLEIVSGRLGYANLNGDAILETDTYIVVPEGDYTVGFGLPKFIVSGAIYDLEVQNGTAFGNDLYVTNASTVIIDASNNIDFDNVWVDLVSTLNMTAGDSIVFNVQLDVDDSVTTLDAAVDIDMPLVTATSHTTLNMSAGGNITIPLVNLDNSTTDLNAGGTINITTLGLTDANTGDGVTNTATATAVGNIGIDTVGANDSDLTLVSTGGQITVPDINATSSTMLANAFGDVNFHELDGVTGDITLISTNGGVYAQDADSYMKMHDAGCALTLSALQDIGQDSLRIRMDIPAAVVLNVLHADNYYIDAMMIPVPPPPADPVYTGTDEFGNEITNDGAIPNDYIMPIGAETVSTDFDEITAEEWTERLMSVLTREQWLALIVDGSISDMILAGEIGADILSEYLFDDTITTEEIELWLSVNPTTPEWQDTLDWLADLELALRTILIDTEGQEPTKELPDVITDEMAALLLEFFISESALSQIEEAAAYMTPDEIAVLAALIAQRLSEESAATADAVDLAARAFNVLVGQSIGLAFVTNEGDINITQQTGTMTIGFIDSFRGDVSLTTLDTSAGDIIGGTIVLAPPPIPAPLALNAIVLNGSTGATHIEARDIALSAAGSIGDVSSPLIIDEISNRAVAVYNILELLLTLTGMGTAEESFVRGTLAADVRFDWLRLYDANDATRVDAIALGDITINEARGNMGIGVMNAGGTVTLSVPFGITDVRESSETDRNITAAALSLKAYNLGIGTAQRYIETQITGHTDAVAMDSIFIDELGDMDMSSDSVSGEINANATQDMILNNTFGDMILGLVIAGGFATITADGAIVEGDRRGALATITANGMALTAGGEIGTLANPFEVDTGVDTFSADCTTLYLAEISDDLFVKLIITTGDAQITVPGSVFDTNSMQYNIAVASQAAANRAQNIATAVQTTATVLQDFADRIWTQIFEADWAKELAWQDWSALQFEVDALKAFITAETDPDELKKLNKQLAALEEDLADAALAYDEAKQFALDTHAQLDASLALAQSEADVMQLIADDLQFDADQAQLAAGQAKSVLYLIPSTMQIGGSLNISAGASIGEIGHGLAMDVDANVTLTGGEQTGDNVSITSHNDINLTKILAGGTVQAATLGNLINAADNERPVIKASIIDLSALSADIGQQDSYLHVCTNELSAIGDNIYIYNCKPLIIHEIYAPGTVELEVKGGVTPGTGPIHITAGTLKLKAKGNIGSLAMPLALNVDNLTMRGRHIYISSIAETLNILGMRATTIHIIAGGNVIGKVITRDIWVDAFGSIGTVDVPFGIYATGRISLTTVKGIINYVNLFHRHYRSWNGRQLESRYRMLFIMRIPFMLRVRGELIPSAVYVAIGLRLDGTWDVLGIWLPGDDDTESIGLTILSNLFERGAEQFDIVYADGIEGMSESMEEIYPDSVMSVNTLQWLINSGLEIDELDFETLVADLGTIYAAASLSEAQSAFDSFAAAWEAKYPQVTAHIEDNWESLEEFYEAVSFLSAAGYDMQLLTQALCGIIDSVGNREWYTNEMDPVYKAFIQALKFFPEYR